MTLSPETPVLCAVPLRCPPSPLAGAALALQITGLQATLTLEQRYQNTEQHPIEVSYVCAMPSDAVLLDVQAELAGQILRGQIEARGNAEARYETALAEGHSAWCLRMVDDELLHIALGNLLPGETLVLRLTLGWWLNPDEGRARITVPLTLAPRYGTPDLEPHEVPEFDAVVSYPARLQAEVHGWYAGATVACISHPLRVLPRTHAQLQFAIDQACMDRDIVLDLSLPPSPAAALDLVAWPDHDDQALLMLTWRAPQPDLAATPVIAEFLLDCSGSMAGTSIQQARAALQAIIPELGPADRLNVLRFGSHHEQLLRRPQPLTPVIQHTLHTAAATLEANLGGTELMRALHAALDDLRRVPAEVPGQRILFIVSDGEVWNPDTQAFLQRCAQERVRVFAVAVGNAAVEATFLPLTRATGGALERALPGEAMAARIQRHFRRIRHGPVQDLRVQWPAPPNWTWLPTAVFPGETHRLLARIPRAALASLPPHTTVDVQWRCGEQSGCIRHALPPLVEDLPHQAGIRLAATLSVAGLSDSAATRLAERYQLLTPHTGLTLVQQRSEAQRADALPALRVVPQMLAAGWGGYGDDRWEGAAEGMMAAPASRTRYAAADAAPVMESLQEALTPGQRARSAAPQRTPVRTQQPPLAAMPAAPLHAPGAGRATPSASPHPTPGHTLAQRIHAQLRTQPHALQQLLEGRYGLATLPGPLTVDELNWLDEAAEQAGLTLADAAFWIVLVHAWMQDPLLRPWFTLDPDVPAPSRGQAATLQRWLSTQG